MEDILVLNERKYVDALVEKWGSKFSYKDKSTTQIMAQVLENQARLQRAQLSEADQTTTTLGVSVFPNSVVYPLVDQIFPRLIAMQICQVRPMRTSTATVRYLTRKFSSDSSAFAHTGTNASTAEVGTVPLGRLVWTSDSVSAEKFSLRARYSLETVDDARMDGDFDFENLMLRALADEIIGEIDHTVLNAMFTGATSTAVSYSTSAHSGETVKEHQQELWDAIIDASNNVFSNMQRPANFIVGDPTAVGRIEKLQSFNLIPGATDDVASMASVRVGTLNNQFAVYKTTMAPANKLLVGIAGEGYLYCPYIPLELTPSAYYDATEEVARGVRTRFGRKMIRGDAYSVVNIS